MLRAIRDAIPGLAALSKTETAQDVLKTLRGRKAVKNPLSFAAHQILAPTERVANHPLVDTNLTAVLRHRSRDIDILLEIFTTPRAYEMPPEVCARLPEAPKVLDLGGNVGLFALYVFSETPAARVTSIEPDPRTLTVLHSARTMNLHHDWTIIDAAASNTEGTLMLEFFGGYSQTRVSDTGAVEVRSMDVLPLMREVDLVKIDIEGSEWPILADPRLNEVKAPIVMEWHKFRAPGLPAHEAAESALRGAGFVTREQHADTSSGQIWAWRP